MSPRKGSGANTRPTQAEVEARLTDLHYAIFELMPDEGRTLHFNPQVISVRLVRDRLNSRLAGEGPKYTSADISAEIRSLAAYDLVTSVKKLSGHVVGWQRSRRAKELLEAKKLLEAKELLEAKGAEESASRDWSETPLVNLRSLREGKGR